MNAHAAVRSRESVVALRGHGAEPKSASVFAHIGKMLAISLAIWTVAVIPALVFAYNAARDAGEHPALLRTVLYSLAAYWSFAVLSLPMYWLSGRLPLHERPRWKAIGAHIVAYPLYACVYSVSRALFFVLLGVGKSGFFAQFTGILLGGLFAYTWAYFLMVAGSHAIRY